MSEAHRSSAFSKAKAIARPRLQAAIDGGSGWCFDGRHPLRPGVGWDVSHVVAVHVMKASGVPESQWHQQENLTSSCRKHNRAAGGRAGAKISNHTKATNDGRIDEW